MIKIINPNQSHPEIKHLESGATFQLPHGSGIDTNWTWVDEEGGCLSFHNEWHALDNNGCYCGWIPFEVIVRYDPDKQRFDYSVTVDDGQIQSIVEGYEETVDDNGDIETNAPYLDDLADVIHSAIEGWNWYLPTFKRHRQIAKNIKQIESLLVETAVNTSLVNKEMTIQKLIDTVEVSVSKSTNVVVKDVICNALWPMLTTIAQNNKEE